MDNSISLHILVRGKNLHKENDVILFKNLLIKSKYPKFSFVEIVFRRCNLSREFRK